MARPSVLSALLISIWVASVLAIPPARPAAARSSEDGLTCANTPSPVQVYLDTSAKIRGRSEQQVCSPRLVEQAKPVKRQATGDYSCDQSRPCSNGACCAKTGYCGYGVASCGTTGLSPNDACWSNCNAKAECGKDALIPNTTCPVNVCCSQYGFCGTTSDFCDTAQGCQSNCGIPTSSGKTGGDVQSRIIGYYEAWNYNSGCIGVSLQNLPVGSLTHLNLAFGYITPYTYQIAMMPGVPADVITQITALKSQNPGIKLIMSLGGWSFNDNGTNTQPVYGTMVSTLGNRLTFIVNLIAFMNQYGFDGVDFDWEYPGAGDRGGNPSDGANFEEFLFELNLVNIFQPKRFIVSFTTPTSYWYLQHFQISSTMQWVDFTNLMAYDLHGTWDSPQDQIGSIILAHTNLTEIANSLSLFWRNGVDPAKINLGIGFYGRSFQLSDPNCWQPGCPFKGGAFPGPCSQSSGILSYNEITNIIKQNNLVPYWDKENAVKYMTWDTDQWVSYDDKDTFQQKIEYANSQGLGGMLIWAIDLDTPDLDAMQALVYPKSLNAFNDKTTDTSYWQSATMGACRLTDCGSGCVAGEITITSQPCGGSVFPTGNSYLCCPLAAAPDPGSCQWRGNPPFCNGHCQDGEVPMEQNKWGDSGSYCSDGNYVYCCAVPKGKATGCRQTGCGGSCNSNEISMAGYFYDACWFDPMQLCCENPNGYSNCYWQGKPGSCYDNNCKFGTEIQLAESYDGGGSDCGIQLSRQRVFCCTPPNGDSPFLPVPLEYLFPSPPTGNDVNTKFKLSLDDTWGGKETQGDEAPNDAAFGFFVMSSPQEIQISLNKRDGSHWELFDCFDDETEGEHTIRMFCGDISSTSNCDKIGLGHGVPGTILEMPNGCGPGIYAVAKDMKVSQNQTIPHHFMRRSGTFDPTVFDLTFDYDFTRVPRDLGTTQMRVDYSNQEGYWDAVVDRAGDRRRKRSLNETGGNHKRWLEEAWREDHKLGLISREELHERWFGSDILDWLGGLFSVATAAPKVTHSVSETLNVILLQEQFQCELNGVNIEAKLNAQAMTNVQIDTSFGLTIITTLSFPPDLSQSYLFFENKGSVTAVFTLDAIVSATYQSPEIELFGLQNFGATFSVPGLLTVGPNFRIFGSVNVDVAVSGQLSAEVVLANWDTRITMPDQGSTYNPTNLATPNAETAEVGSPTFDWSVSAHGQVTAHVKPMVSFGITWNPLFGISSCEVDLVADGYVQFYLTAQASGSGHSVCYGANTGANLYAQIQAPSQFNWILPTNPWKLGNWGPAPVIQETCPISNRDVHIEGPVPRALIEGPNLETSRRLREVEALSKRGTTVIGPLLRLPFGLSCPGASSADTSGNISSCPLCDDESPADLQLAPRQDGSSCWVVQSGGESFCSAGISARSEFEDFTDNSTYSTLEKRTQKNFPWVVSGYGALDGTYTLPFGDYPSCSTAATNGRIMKWLGFQVQNQPCLPNIVKLNANQIYTKHYVTEHVFEPQILLQFFDWLIFGTMPIGNGYTNPTYAWVTETIVGIDLMIYGAFTFTTGNINPTASTVFQQMAVGVGDGGATNARELVLAYGDMNNAKGIFFNQGTPGTDQGNDKLTKIQTRNVAGVFQYVDFTPPNNGEWIWNKFMRPSNWMDLVCREFDNTYVWGSRAGEPTKAGGGRASLRWLWAKFIDMTLLSIETRASGWAGSMAPLYDPATGTYAPQNPGDLAWRNSAFGPGGWATAANLRFPRVAGNGYGVYGNQAMCFNWFDNPVALGAPTP